MTGRRDPGAGPLSGRGASAELGGPIPTMDQPAMTDQPPDPPRARDARAITGPATAPAEPAPPVIPAPRTATDPPALPDQAPGTADDLPDPIGPPADGEELAQRADETDEEFTHRLITTVPAPTPELIERIAALLGYLPRRR